MLGDTVTRIEPNLLRIPRSLEQNAACLALQLRKYEWCRDYLSDWPALQWAAMRLVSLSTSATACEHSWSIEAWVHSKTSEKQVGTDQR